MWQFARPHIYLAAVINQYKGREITNFMVQTALQQNLSPQTKPEASWPWISNTMAPQQA